MHTQTFLKRWFVLIASLVLATTAGYYIFFYTPNTNPPFSLEEHEPYYLGLVNKLHAKPGERLQFWSGGYQNTQKSDGTVGYQGQFLIYDDADQVALPQKNWTSLWRERANRLGVASLFTRRLVRDKKVVKQTTTIEDLKDHFYLVKMTLDSICLPSDTVFQCFWQDSD